MSTATLVETEPRHRPPRLVADPREAAPVGLVLRVETPENVVLAHQLAGPAPRAAAYLIDLAFRVLIFIVLLVVLQLGFRWLPGTSTGFLLLGLFLLEWGYFVVCEGFFNGRTIGKAVMNLRVIQEKGYAVTTWSVLLRNLLRAADYMLFLAPAFVSMLLTRRFQRLGDLVAHTVVVCERVLELPREPVIVERIAPLKRDEIGSWVPPRSTLTLIDEFLGRRAPSRIPPERGHQIVARLARVLARRLDYRGDRERLEKYPMAFLAQVYVTFARRDDEDQPGGNGRGAKSRDDESRRLETAEADDVFELDDGEPPTKANPRDLDEIVARDTARERRLRERLRARGSESRGAGNLDQDEDEDDR